VGLVGAGGDAVGEVAELQLGVAEEGSIGGGGEGACDLGDEVVGALADGIGEFPGEGFLLGGELGQGQGAFLATRAVDFWPKGRSVPLCTKIPPTVETSTLVGAAGNLFVDGEAGGAQNRRCGEGRFPAERTVR
jgi:hypothetical protein